MVASRHEAGPFVLNTNLRLQQTADHPRWGDALRLDGYRLPTEAEWEYACRAGAGTSRYYGAGADLLRRYAWYIATSQEHARPCGSLLPNELGLFDMLGNVYEWCQEVPRVYQPDRTGTILDNITIYVLVDDTNPRLLRGGSFINPPASVRSARAVSASPRWAVAPTTASTPPGLTP